MDCPSFLCPTHQAEIDGKGQLQVSACRARLVVALGLERGLGERDDGAHLRAKWGDDVGQHQGKSRGRLPGEVEGC